MTEPENAATLTKRDSRMKIRLFALSVCTAIGFTAVWWLRLHPEFIGQLLPATEVEQEYIRHSKLPFDLTNLTIPGDAIIGGGPLKDGIPALTDPKLISVEQAGFMKPEDRIIGVYFEGVARAYPIKILTHHEVVNDTIGKTLFAVTYCPLCDSATAFDRKTPLGERTFGVSGRLYNSNVLIYDRSNELDSLWSQLQFQGVSGSGAKQHLSPLPLELTTWKNWLQRYPNSQVLSPETGHVRDYDQNPYADYFNDPDLMYSTEHFSEQLPTKAPVLGVWTDAAAKAYPISFFNSEKTRLEDELDGKKFVLTYEPNAQSLRVSEADQGVHWAYSFWFAWYAFHPETDVAE